MNCEIYLAEVVGAATAGNTRLQVRVIPDMQDIPDEKCPAWPSFFKDKIFWLSVGSKVWVICNKEFTLGYILGEANETTLNVGQSVFEKNSISENFLEDINKDNKSYFKSTKKEIDPYNSVVTYWDKDCVHFINKSDGSLTVCYRNGSIFKASKSSMYMSVGSSVLNIDESGIALKADRISLTSPNVQLGNSNQGYVMVSGGSTSGKNAVTSTCVQA